MHEKEAEYHEKPKEERPSQDLTVTEWVWSPLLLHTCPHCATEKHRTWKGEKKKKKAFYSNALLRLIF